MSGPRILFKDDRDSGIGRGCVLYAGHFRPEVACIPRAVADTAPHELIEVVLSEGWRPPRSNRDLHSELRAFDVSLNGLDGDEQERGIKGAAWADRMRVELGRDYDVVVHGEGSNLHIHVELDP